MKPTSQRPPVSPLLAVLVGILSVQGGAALAKGLTSTGLHVLDVGVVPTPLTYFAANTLPVDGLAGPAWSFVEN